MKLDAFKVKEAIEETRYTIWPVNTQSGIGRIVANINPVTHCVNLSVYYIDGAQGNNNGIQVLNPEELEALRHQVDRLKLVCKIKYGNKE